MINIQESRIIRYDQDRKSVTVYRDFEKTNLWYIVPTPQLGTQTVGSRTIPAFSLTEYKNNTGSTGVVTFTVELTIDTDAYQAVRNALGPNIEIGQFSWIDSEAYLTYSLDGKTSSQVNVTPSNYAGNSATFILNLKTTDELNSVKKLFSGGGGLSTWSVQYVTTTLSQLPAVTATVTYDSAIAASYEKTVHIDRNIWGSETGRRVTVREQLKKSDSGKVDLVWSTPPSDEFRQRVHDWAFTTLEGLVDAAAAAVARQLGQNTADSFNISSVGSFKRVYQENQVIEWTITPQNYLPTFSATEWKDHYSLADNRHLLVAVTLLQNLKEAKIRQVEVGIRYAGRAGIVTNLFTATGPTVWTYDSEGAFIGNEFISEYFYTYKVYYEDGRYFGTEETRDTSTALDLSFADLGYQRAIFYGANVDFGKGDQQVSFVLIDFTYKPNGTAKLYVDQKQLNKNGENDQIVFESHTYLPSDAAYNFALTYVLNDGTFLVTTPQTVFAPANRGKLAVLNILGPSVFSVAVQNQPAPSLPTITGVTLNAQYSDPQISGTIQKKSFNNFKIGEDWFDSWDFVGSTTSTSAVIRFDGTVMYRDSANASKQVQIRDVRYDLLSTSVLFLEPVLLPFTVTFDPSLIDWDTYQQVEVEVFRTDTPLRVQDAALVPDHLKTDIVTLIFKPADAAEGTRVLPYPQYYTFTRYAGTATQYYYSAVYYDRANGQPHNMGDVGAVGTAVVLPRNAASAVRQLNGAVLEALVALDAEPQPA